MKKTQSERKALVNRFNEITFRLCAKGAISFGQFSLRVLREYVNAHPEEEANIPWSPIYINLRVKPRGPLESDDIYEIGECLYRIARLHGVWGEFVVGVPKGAVPLAEAFAEYARRDGKRIAAVSFDKELYHPHGDKATFSFKGDALIVEDVITFGDSSLRFIENVVRPLSMRPVALLACFDREQGGTSSLTRHGISSYILNSVSGVMDLLKEYELVDVKTHEKVLQYPAQLNRFLNEIGSIRA